MNLTQRDISVIIFAMNYLRSNLDEVVDAFAEPGVASTISMPTENELDNIIAKLERMEG